MKNHFKIPVAYSEQARAILLEWEDEDSARQRPQSSEARKATVEQTLAWAIDQWGSRSSLVFEVYLVPRDGEATEPQRVRVAASLARTGLYIIVHMPDESVDAINDSRTLCTYLQQRAA